MNDLYNTIGSPSESIYREKGSRFLGYAFPVDSEEEIGRKLAELKKQYHDARHHCYAWRLGANMEKYRFNDDGEPSGSAGRPILGQIESRDLTGLLLVVVRYFGGTLLGVGGLIRAYRTAAALALEGADIIEKKVEGKLSLEFGYGEMNAVMKVVKDFDLRVDTPQFDLTCTMNLYVWIRLLPPVKERLSLIEGCKVMICY